MEKETINNVNISNSGYKPKMGGVTTQPQFEELVGLSLEEMVAQQTQIDDYKAPFLKKIHESYEGITQKLNQVKGNKIDNPDTRFQENIILQDGVIIFTSDNCVFTITQDNGNVIMTKSVNGGNIKEISVISEVANKIEATYKVVCEWTS